MCSCNKKYVVVLPDGSEVEAKSAFDARTRAAKTPGATWKSVPK